MVACRICLTECEQFKVFDDTEESISYLDMLKIVANIRVENKDILCTVCSSELLISYHFLIKIRINNVTSFKQHFFNKCCEENVIQKDPLEGSSDENPADEDASEAHLTTFGNLNNDKKEIFKADENTDNFSLNDDSTSNDKFDGEVLLNNLSDLNVLPENVIFPRGRYKCQVCNKNYFTSIGLNAHNEVHQPKLPSKKKKRVRRQHKKKATNEISEAEHSTTEVTTELETTKNVNLETLDAIQPKLRKEKEAKQKKTFPCQVCGKQMISASKLRYHMVMHTGQKDFLCSMCPKAYSTIYALKHHFRSHSGDRPYECQFCGDRFYRTTTLKSHVRRHTNERPYGCEICGKRFIQHSSMTTHIKLNHMAKTIPCPHCDKKYARQTDLNTHLLSHTGDKPFSCQLCPSRFIRQANLNKHMNQHHSERQNEFKKT